MGAEEDGFCVDWITDHHDAEFDGSNGDSGIHGIRSGSANLTGAAADRDIEEEQTSEEERILPDRENGPESAKLTGAAVKKEEQQLLWNINKAFDIEEMKPPDRKNRPESAKLTGAAVNKGEQQLQSEIDKVFDIVEPEPPDRKHRTESAKLIGAAVKNEQQLQRNIGKMKPPDRKNRPESAKLTGAAIKKGEQQLQPEIDKAFDIGETRPPDQKESGNRLIGKTSMEYREKKMKKMDLAGVAEIG